MRRSGHDAGPRGGRARRWVAATAAAGLVLVGAAGAHADDPLDDTDGTEDWDQVAPSGQPERPPEQDDFREEITAWQQVSQQWEQERLRYIEERSVHKRVCAAPRVLPRADAKRPVGYQPDADINDDNYTTAGDDGDWGDPPGTTMLAPTGALERAIDSEIQESGAGSRPAAAKPAPARPLVEPAPGGEELPSAFRGASSGDDWGDEPVVRKDPRAEEAARKREAEARAKAEAAIRADEERARADEEKARAAEEKARAAEEEKARIAADKARLAEEERQRKEAEEEARRKIAEEEARRNREAEEGAAAAARFLKEQAEREAKEQEALRKKAGVEEDAEGQVVDPEIKKEMGEDEETPEEE